jgi:hypothetical protein
MKLVLDIVGNHGSPAWGMAYDQPKFGKLYDRDGTLVASTVQEGMIRVVPQAQD